MRGVNNWLMVVRAAAFVRAGTCLSCASSPAAAAGKRWSDAHVVDGSRRWIEMIRSYTICPLARPYTTKVVVSTSGLDGADLLALSSGDDRDREGPRSPPGFEMVDVSLLREEASLLLSDGDFRASTMVVFPHANALDSLMVMSMSTDAEVEEEGIHVGPNSNIATLTSVADAELELAEAVAVTYARNRWLEKIMPSGEVQPLPFYPFFLSRNGIEYQTMPWFSIQLIRRSELAAARDEWCRMLGMTEAEYDASGGPNQRTERRRHLVNAAAPELTELFLEVRGGEVPCADAPEWRRAAGRCAEREASRWAALSAQ